MTTRVRKTSATLVAAMLVLSACSDDRSDGGPASSGGCYGPWLEKDADGEPPLGAAKDPIATVNPGETHEVYGHGYQDGCNDSIEGDVQPLPPVQLTVTFPGGESMALGELVPRANEQGTDIGFVASVEVPSGTPSGTAVVRDDRTPSTTYRFKVGD